MSITFIKQPTEYGDQWYPFFIGTFREMIREYNPKELNDINMLKLGYFSTNPWHALEQLADDGVFDRGSIKALKDSCEYDCPITDQKFYALLPLCIFSNDLDKYFVREHKPWYYEMAVDKAWNCEEDNSHLKPKKWAITEATYLCILGPGYTDFTMPYDGSPGQEIVMLDLSNGDKMLAVARAWYNK